MRLHTRTWGDRDRTALLVHGIMSDSRTWHRVAPKIAEQGYRVIGVDLRGHGQSGRGRYTPQDWADDLVESLPEGIDVAIGHSLGAVALALAVDRLRPARVVYGDPAFLVDGRNGDPRQFRQFKHATREDIVARSPRWSSEDVDTELATLRDWDPDTVEGAALIAGADVVPLDPVVPSLVLLATESHFFSEATAGKLRQRGLQVRIVPGVGHTIHRDDLDAFVGALEGWI
ncbi:alpha/beta fold hydrolase [Phytoactinopolyspora mesophila]|uniref:Alpha/beta fold hydrolase n=1 Tax=Phytoactinopolyspora mesophila TaxID=2650750 RepID=A0A7K3M937_9ACTN|nr:alpha/beta hydrolase [Phytoactinopolyspora mesophila]NDL59487.1 alpha/beta fold hydrolase [Phytoactinopolyspora mesophila]